MGCAAIETEGNLTSNRRRLRVYLSFPCSSAASELFRRSPVSSEGGKGADEAEQSRGLEIGTGNLDVTCGHGTVEIRRLDGNQNHL